MGEPMRKILNRNLFRQRIFWGNLDYNGLSFTDIDAYMNYKEKVLFFIELKRQGKELGYAQRKAFEAICKNKINSIFIFAWHNNNDYLSDIELGNCFIHKIFINNEWKIIDYDITVDCFIKNIVYEIEKELRNG